MDTHTNIQKPPRLLVFASGGKEGGGSGFANLVAAARKGTLKADIVGVVSNHEYGGVREHATRLGITFYHFPLPREAADYQKFVTQTGADFVALSGWLKLAVGLDPKKTFNIHPADLHTFGGYGMYGHFAHEAVMAAYARGEVTHSAMSMHFVTEPKSKEDYDKGPLVFRVPVAIHPDDDAKSLGARVNRAEHKYQPVITNAILCGDIYWDGVNEGSVVVPDEFQNLPMFDE